MDTATIQHLLERVRSGEINVDAAVERLKRLPFEDLGFAKLDRHRHLRQGFPEVVLCAGKTTEQIEAIVTRHLEGESNLLATRATTDVFECVKAVAPDAVWHEPARAITVVRNPLAKVAGTILVVTAGTADMPVAEEAAVTADVLGNHVERAYDVGIAGIHRLFGEADKLRAASVLIVCAGMEGALPSVVGGLVDKPVIGVPTSTGYGANFGGVTPLLAMLNSCAAGVLVVNIDNGFGAGFAASLINHLGAAKQS
ncbi:MAG: nickel pincer cofactor biosynthesis protein LarB [Verrucomicrobia bacterium]|nr:nickel pincer cofactor biosynthesis protein LarB [Verrucomicrobiota bacterium]